MADLIPPPIYEIIREFLKQRRSGAVTLFASDGRIQSYDVKYGGKIPKTGEEVDIAVA